MAKRFNAEQHFFLRNARGDEFDAYADLVVEAHVLHHQAVPEHFKTPDQVRPTEDEFLRWLTDPDRMLDVAVEDPGNGQRIVGLIQSEILTCDENRVREADRLARVDLIVVKQSHQRRGIGRALLKRARIWAEAKAASGMTLNTYAFNMVAARLYEKAGFDVLKKTYVQDFSKPDNPLTRAW